MATILKYDKGLLVPVEKEKSDIMNNTSRTMAVQNNPTVKRVGKVAGDIIVINALISLGWFLVKAVF
jgi:hypothetical protein